MAPLEPAFPEPASQPAPYPSDDQELESQQAPDPAADIEALAGQNCSLKRKGYLWISSKDILTGY